MFMCKGLLILIILMTSCMAQTRPNIVVIMADDMGWGDVGVNWPLTLDTPSIDDLAHNGLRLTDFHSGASVCTPSRAALLTGRLGLRTGIIKNFAEDALSGIPTNETTIAEILLAAGYRTAMLGKWHLGTRPGHHPLDKGLQSYLGVPYSVDMGCADPPGANLPACPACPEDNSVYQFVPAPENCIMDTALPLYKDKTVAHQPVKLANLSTMYSDFAKNFIQNISSTAPYFLYAALSHMHVPLAHAHKYDNVSGRGEYADTLREMDQLVRSILSAVRETDNNTIIWFTSDNGPWEVKCQLAGSVGPFIGMWQASPEGGGGGSGAKMTVWEAGHRVPSILYWPDHIEMSLVPLLLSDLLDEVRRPVSLFDQNFGMGMVNEDLLSPSVIAPLRIGYYRPWRNLTPRHSGVSNIHVDKDGFKVNLDVQQFKPDELTVKVMDDFVVVEGKHEERQDEHGFISRQFQRRYKLSSDIDSSTVVSQLSSDGVLTITAPKKALPSPTSNERVVPITQTQAPAVKQTAEAKSEGGRVSGALTSALDILPTLTALGEGKLPTDRQYDGKNMMPIITGTSESIRQVLYHPNSGVGEDGVIGALRVDNYKVVFYSGGAPDCSGQAGPVQNHTESPLVFKLDMDLSEGSPLDRNSSEDQATVELATQYMLDLQESIRNDNTSTVDYRGGSQGRVCCNSDSPICRCPWD